MRPEANLGINGGKSVPPPLPREVFDGQPPSVASSKKEVIEGTGNVVYSKKSQDTIETRNGVGFGTPKETEAMSWNPPPGDKLGKKEFNAKFEADMKQGLNELIK